MSTGGAAIVGTKTASAPVNQQPPNLRPERESPASTQTGGDDPTSLDRAVWKDEGTLDWVLHLSNGVSTLPGGTSMQVYAQVKGPQTQSRLLVITEPRETFNLKRGIVIGVPEGYSGGNRATHLISARSRTSPPHPSPYPRKSL